MAGESESESALVGKRILLVEDSEDNQVLICQFLRLTGAVVDVAEDGQVGVQRALTENYDAILMDIHMPNLDGFQATQRIRQSGFRKPILAITAHAMEECWADTLGFDEHLPKPIDRERLIESIRRHIGNC